MRKGAEVGRLKIKNRCKFSILSIKAKLEKRKGIKNALNGDKASTRIVINELTCLLSIWKHRFKYNIPYKYIKETHNNINMNIKEIPRFV